MPDTTADNGRITLAVIANKIDAMAEQLRGHINENREFCRETEARLRNLENWQYQAQTEIKTMRSDIDDAQSTAHAAKAQSSWWNGANSIAAFIALILGAFGIKQQ